MSSRKISGLCLLVLTAAVVALTRGQEAAAPPPLPGQPRPFGTDLNPVADKAPPVIGASTPPAAQPARDLSKLSPLQHQMYLTAQRGADWLFRANRADGRFEYGFLPCLKTNLEGDHYLHQAGAAMALARSSRLTGNERHAAVAKQAILTLLLDTNTQSISEGRMVTHQQPDKPRIEDVRFTTLPSVIVNRLAAAGLLVLAINELPNPADDLLDQSEQLCQYIRLQQRDDGSLSFSDDPADLKAAHDSDGINSYPGEALYGLTRSQQHRSAAWKTEAVKKALGYYRSWWQKNKNMAFVRAQTAAYAEAYLQSQGKETACADFVFEMTDWICGMQYTAIDPKHPLWLGGFMSFQGGRPANTPPDIFSASYAAGLVEACRVARQAADVNRYQRYRETLDRCLQFLTTLQYTEANTQHFADWYRPRLLGGFHASHQDGSLRIDFTQQAVCTLAQYLALD
jgi:hypothetical protein